MASRKESLMAQFYEQCQIKGYTDMKNDVQSLKAKVIANDLKLNYGNIVTFYEKAKAAYDLVEKEKKEVEEYMLSRKKEAEEEAKRKAIDGTLLLTANNIKGADKKEITLRVYIRPDGSIYSTINDGFRNEKIPTIQAKKSESLSYIYNPSETVFSSVTIGNVTTGSIRETGPSYSERISKDGKGCVHIISGYHEFDAELITVSQYTQDCFKRDAAFNELVHDGQIYCVSNSNLSNSFKRQAIMGDGDIYSKMNLLSMSVNVSRLEYDTCVKIANLVVRIVTGTFPPSDEEIYRNADALVHSQSSSQIKRGIELFNSIADYADAEQRAKSARETYQMVLQEEKERAVIEKEERIKARKKRKPLVILFIIALIVLAGIQLRYTALIDQTLANTSWNSNRGNELRFKENYCYCGWRFGLSKTADYKVVFVFPGEAVLRIKGESFGTTNFTETMRVNYEVDEDGTYIITQIVWEHILGEEIFSRSKSRF